MFLDLLLSTMNPLDHDGRRSVERSVEYEKEEENGMNEVLSLSAVRDMIARCNGR